MTYCETPHELCNIVRRLNEDSNVHFIVNGEELSSTLDSANWSNEIETVLKKMSVYADKVIFLYGQIESKEAPQGWEKRYYLHNIASLAKHTRLRERFEKTFLFIPSSVIAHSLKEIIYYDCVPYRELNDPTTFDFNAEYKNKLGYPIKLNSRRFISHFLENESTSLDEGAVLNIWLPRIKNIPLETFLKIRDDNEESFEKLQYAIKKFLKESKAETTESKLKELFEYMHHQIIHYNNEMEKVRKSRALRTYQMVVSTSIVGLAFTIDSDTMKTITSFLGLYQGKDYISFLFQQKERLYDFELSEFYLPWRINKENFKRRGFLSFISRIRK